MISISLRILLNDGVILGREHKILLYVYIILI